MVKRPFSVGRDRHVRSGTPKYRQRMSGSIAGNPPIREGNHRHVVGVISRPVRRDGASPTAGPRPAGVRIRARIARCHAACAAPGPRDVALDRLAAEKHLSSGRGSPPGSPAARSTRLRKSRHSSVLAGRTTLDSTSTVTVPTAGSSKTDWAYHIEFRAAYKQGGSPGVYRVGRLLSPLDSQKLAAVTLASSM